MKLNKIINALFNSAYTRTTVDKAVFAANQAVTETDAKCAICAGYIAAERSIPLEKINADKLMDEAGLMLAKANDKAEKPNNFGRRSAGEQSIYLKTNSLYNYYYGVGKSSKGKKKASKKSVKLNVWQSLVIDYLSAHPNVAAKIAHQLGLEAE
jgi:hypothetical protein